jgi:hypothetical protein
MRSLTPTSLGTSSGVEFADNAYGIMGTLTLGKRTFRFLEPFDTFSAGTAVAFATLCTHINAYGQDSVAALYSGVPNVHAYCVTEVVRGVTYDCTQAIGAITKDMQLIPNGDPSLVRPANPNDLSFPCND